MEVVIAGLFAPLIVVFVLMLVAERVLEAFAMLVDFVRDFVNSQSW